MINVKINKCVEALVTYTFNNCDSIFIVFVLFISVGLATAS